MKSITKVLLVALLLTGCQTAPPLEEEPDPTPLTISMADYYAINGTKTLILENVIASREATLQVVANCVLLTGQSPSAVIYAGTITVETLGSNRALQIYGSVPSPGATSIDCTSIVGDTGHEQVTFKLR